MPSPGFYVISPLNRRLTSVVAIARAKRPISSIAEQLAVQLTLVRLWVAQALKPLFDEEAKANNVCPSINWSDLSIGITDFQRKAGLLPPAAPPKKWVFENLLVKTLTTPYR